MGISSACWLPGELSGLGLAQYKTIFQRRLAAVYPDASSHQQVIRDHQAKVVVVRQVVAFGAARTGR